jgi:hypothetical protein
MATQDVTSARAPTPGVRPRRSVRYADETKLSLKTTEFWAMVVVIAGVLIASAVSDTLGDVRAWTLVSAVAIGYMLSRGLAKSGSKYIGEEDPLRRGDRSHD